MNARLKEFIGMLADYGQAVANAATEIHTNGAREIDQFIGQTESAAKRIAEYFHGGFVDVTHVAEAVAPISPDHIEQAFKNSEA